MPRALAVVAVSRPVRRAAAAVAPKMPQIAVGWKPRAWNLPEAAVPSRVIASLPATIPASTSGPASPRAWPTASAAGQVTVEMCETESECVSSKSSPWQSIAFAKAAFGPGSCASSPITVACASPPSSAIACRPSVAVPVAWAARPQPSVSSRWSFAWCATSSGTSSSASVVANSASRSAAVMSHRPFRVGSWKCVLHLGGVSLVDHERPLELDHDLAALVEPPAAHRNDADARVRLRLAQLGDLALGPERVADEDGLRQLDVRPGEVGSGVLGRVRNGQPRYERERERAVHERLAELRPLGVWDVEVNRVRVHRQAREPDVVRVGDRAAETAAVDVADGEVLVETALPFLGCGHCPASWRMRRARSTTGLSTIVPFTDITPSLWPSNASTTPRAQAISCSLGEKIRLIVSTCPGWMQALPRKPSARASRHCSSRPASSPKSRWTTSNGPRRPAAAESMATFERA